MEQTQLLITINDNMRSQTNVNPRMRYIIGGAKNPRQQGKFTEGARPGRGGERTSHGRR